MKKANFLTMRAERYRGTVRSWQARYRAFRKRFDRAALASYTGAMDIHLDPDLQAKLAKLAAERGRDPETLAKEAIQRFVGYDEWFIEEVEKGLAQIERGQVLTHEEVGARLEKLLAEKRSSA